MKLYFNLFFSIILLTSCQQDLIVNVPELMDNNPDSYYKGIPGMNYLAFNSQFKEPIQSYTLFSSGNDPVNDPVEWTLKGSYDGKKWITIDEQKDQTFFSRFQERTYAIANPSNYTQYLFEIKTTGTDSLILGNISFHEENLMTGWEEFRYPEIDFKDLDPETQGSAIYQQLVQDPEKYVQYHAQKVAEILFYTARDTMNDVQGIRYTLKDYEGVSAKSGNPPVIAIVYSTQHIEKAAGESMLQLDYETRGVLYHELVHAYQFEPKGIGSYSTNREFWASIEGLADAVRAHAGFFDIKARRKPGGHWLDGYQTTGFFIQWLTTKDPDAIRKFHLTVRDLEVWSFDEAMKSMFGPENGIETMWEEYQEYLLTQA
ncbi:MAG: basic secretory family protein [Tannerellaceae bacterium]|nr:basic secretory family protein [Tannerellaceae bacterium]